MRSFARSCVVLLSVARLLRGQTMDCPAEAYKNHDSQTMSAAYNLALLESISEDTFNRNWKQWGGSGGVTVFGAFSLDANANYAQFDEARRRFTSHYSYSEDSQHTEAYVRNSFDGPGSSAYNACLATLAAMSDSRGLFMWFRDVTASAAVVKIRWRPTPGYPSTTVESIQLTGSTTPDSIIARQWSADVEREYVLTRVHDQDLRLVMNMAGDANSVLLPPRPDTVSLCRGDEPLTAGATASAWFTQPGETGDAGHNEGLEAFRAIDPRSDAGWSSRLSGAYPNRAVSISVALAQPSTVRTLRLTVSQTPPGQTVHDVYGTGAGGAQVQLAHLDQFTNDGQVLTVPLERRLGSSLTAITVTTTHSPSWVAWRKLEIIGCPY